MSSSRLEISKTAEESSLNSTSFKANANSTIRTGMLIILIGFVGFLLWAVLAPLDAGVTASGRVEVESKRKTVQHLSGGIVEEILVRDGDHVKKGDILIRLNRTQLEAQRLITLNQLISIKAIEARLLAERIGSTPSFDTPLLADRANPFVLEAIETQSALFNTRKKALESEISILNSNIKGLHQQIEGLQALERGKAEQMRLLKEELDSLRTLFEKGYVPRNRIFELERSVAEISAQRSGDIANIGRAQATLNEIQLKKHQIEQEFRKDVENQLTNVQKEAATLAERLAALDDELSRVEIRSPDDGIVVGLKIHTVGGIIRAGEPILDLVPEHDTLIIEARIQPHLIEKVAPGLVALVRFVALDPINPVVEGKVISVSADILTDAQTGLPYYAARIALSPEQLSRLKYDRITPGMPVDVVIKIGERSLLEYLLKPIANHVFMALKER
ncbi:MAG: HlyD family type I secretion periplasmic adaptor subunit [Gammaproteobacteria bacterium]|nr:HlyD family type I secretion periplasmic adaptor subunit [Gammaproteobacteria bacterium]